MSSGTVCLCKAKLFILQSLYRLLKCILAVKSLCVCAFLLLQLAGTLEGLANAFSEFHQTGQQHSKAGNAVLTWMQKLSGLFEGTSNTLAEPLSQVSLSRISLSPMMADPWP